MAYVLPLGNRWALMRNLRCPKERKANEEWRLCVNLRNNLYINLHISFPRRNHLAEIRHSQRFLSNRLICNKLCSELHIQPSTFRILPCETWPFAVRNMANRDSKHGRSHHALACIATRKTPNRVRFLHFRNRNLAKTAISLAGLRKNPAQVSNQNS